MNFQFRWKGEAVPPPKEKKNVEPEKDKKDEKDELFLPRGYDKIWYYARSQNLGNMKLKDIAKLKNGPTYKTLSKYLGPKKLWACQLECNTPEEGRKILQIFMRR